MGPAIRCRVGARVGTALALLCASTSPGWAQEIWVVNERSRDVSVIDPAVETVVADIPLGGTADPWGIAFSTLAGQAGGFAFVTAGASVHVIDAFAKQVVDTVDIGAFLGHPVVMRGCAAARRRLFLTDGVNAEPRAYLHVAADVQPSPAGPFEPWFVVLDQNVLAGGAPPGTSPVVAAGPLFPSGVPPGSQGHAVDVTVLGASSGEDFQRAWYSARLLGAGGGWPLRGGPLDGGPQPLMLWVDGEPQPARVPDERRLRADRSHVLFFRREGFRPERVLLESDASGTQPRLRPTRVELRLQSLEPRGRALQIELEQEDGDEASKSGASELP